MPNTKELLRFFFKVIATQVGRTSLGGEIDGAALGFFTGNKQRPQDYEIDHTPLS
ncbi:hypothetical protein [Cerasicoccus frondis]|uniref:hypothetical protein n=1 Tax=Cerasicoccus frondis TaxID=490090 RepID=UPI0028527A40|nr:hypothetical protein [Cerasicoccus frondis]